MQNYQTVTEAVAGLADRGYTLNFNLEPGECLSCAEHNIFLHPEEYEIDEVHRFEGMTDPGDSSIVLAVSSPGQERVKGTLVSAYGMYAEPGLSALLTRLPLNR